MNFLYGCLISGKMTPIPVWIYGSFFTYYMLGSHFIFLFNIK